MSYNIESEKGTVVIEGGFTTIRHQRRVAHPRDLVWKAITDPKELAQWFDTKAVIDGRNGGTINFISGIAKFQVTGKILVWDPPHVFEHEFHINPNSQLPSGEPDSVMRWELTRDGDSSTIVTVTLSRLTKATGLGFNAGMHVFLDRLAAQLGHKDLPDWVQRFNEVKKFYPSPEQENR